MTKMLAGALLFLAFIGSSRSDTPAATAAKVAPLYSLPADGTWLEFDLQKDALKGTMRISSVGRTEGQDGPTRWIETKIEVQAEKTKKKGIRFGKLLVKEGAAVKDFSLEENVIEAYHQEDVKGGDQWRIARLTGDKIIPYFTMGVAGELVEASKVEITTKLGKVTCRRVVSTSGQGRLRTAEEIFQGVETVGRDGKKLPDVDAKVPANQRRELVYRAWLTNEVPFGVARFEIWAQGTDAKSSLVFSAEAARTGKDAKSEVDHNLATKPK